MLAIGQDHPLFDFTGLSDLSGRRLNVKSPLTYYQGPYESHAWLLSQYDLDFPVNLKVKVKQFKGQRHTLRTHLWHIFPFLNTCDLDLTLTLVKVIQDTIVNSTARKHNCVK